MYRALQPEAALCLIPAHATIPISSPPRPEIHTRPVCFKLYQAPLRPGSIRVDRAGTSRLHKDVCPRHSLDYARPHARTRGRGPSFLFSTLLHTCSCTSPSPGVSLHSCQYVLGYLPGHRGAGALDAWPSEGYGRIPFTCRPHYVFHT